MKVLSSYENTLKSYTSSEVGNEENGQRPRKTRNNKAKYSDQSHTKLHLNLFMIGHQQNTGPQRRHNGRGLMFELLQR